MRTEEEIRKVLADLKVYISDCGGTNEAVGPEAEFCTLLWVLGEDNGLYESSYAELHRIAEERRAQKKAANN